MPDPSLPAPAADDHSDAAVDHGPDWDRNAYSAAWREWLMAAVCAAPAQDQREVCIVADPRTGEFAFCDPAPRHLDGPEGVSAQGGTLIADRRRLCDVEEVSYWVSLAWERVNGGGEFTERDHASLDRGVAEMVRLGFDEVVAELNEKLARRGGGGRK